MASFRKRNGKWQVQIRQTDKDSVSKTFIRKKDAIYWARNQEILLQTKQWFNSESSDLTIYELMNKYRDVVTSQKRRISLLLGMELPLSGLCNVNPIGLSLSEFTKKDCIGVE